MVNINSFHQEFAHSLSSSLSIFKIPFVHDLVQLNFDADLVLPVIRLVLFLESRRLYSKSIKEFSFH